MEIIDTIKTRRSIRNFKDTPVEKEKLDQVLEAGIMAPSAKNYQSWEFIVVKDSDKIKNISISSTGRCRFEGVPVMIAVCSDMTRVAGSTEERRNRFSIQDCAAATQNILLAAHSLGLGTCWVGSYDETLVREELNIPGHLRLLTLIPVGYPAEQPLAPERKPLNEVVHEEEF